MDGVNIGEPNTLLRFGGSEQEQTNSNNHRCEHAVTNAHMMHIPGDRFSVPSPYSIMYLVVKNAHHPVASPEAGVTGRSGYVRKHYTQIAMSQYVQWPNPKG